MLQKDMRRLYSFLFCVIFVSATSSPQASAGMLDTLRGWWNLTTDPRVNADRVAADDNEDAQEDEQVNEEDDNGLRAGCGRGCQRAKQLVVTNYAALTHRASNTGTAIQTYMNQGLAVNASNAAGAVKNCVGAACFWAYQNLGVPAVSKSAAMAYQAIAYSWIPAQTVCTAARNGINMCTPLVRQQYQTALPYLNQAYQASLQAHQSSQAYVGQAQQAALSYAPSLRSWVIRDSVWNGCAAGVNGVISCGKTVADTVKLVNSEIKGRLTQATDLATKIGNGYPVLKSDITSGYNVLRSDAEQAEPAVMKALGAAQESIKETAGAAKASHAAAKGAYATVKGIGVLAAAGGVVYAIKQAPSFWDWVTGSTRPFDIELGEKGFTASLRRLMGGRNIEVKDLILSPSTSTQMNHYVAEALSAAKLRRNLPSLIVHGPAGTGKSQIVRALAKKANMDVTILRKSSFIEFEGEEIQGIIKFLKRVKHRHMVVFIERLEDFYDAGEDSERALAALDYLFAKASAKSSNIAVVASADSLDPIAPSRLQGFTYQLPISLPTFEERKLILDHYIGSLITNNHAIETDPNFNFDESLLDRLAELTQDFSPADIYLALDAISHDYQKSELEPLTEARIQSEIARVAADKDGSRRQARELPTR